MFWKFILRKTKIYCLAAFQKKKYWFFLFLWKKYAICLVLILFIGFFPIVPPA